MDNYVTICFLITLFLISLIIASSIIVVVALNVKIERLEDAFDKLDDKIIKLEAMMDYVMMKDEVDEHND